MSSVPLRFFLALSVILQSASITTCDDVCSEEPDSALASTACSLLQHAAKPRKDSLSSATIPGLTRAKDALPTDLVELGTQLFGTEDALDKVVAQTSCTPMVYANVSMQICTADGDDAAGRLPGEDGIGYGLDTLLEFKATSNGMLNIADIGGSYGVVTIVSFKKYPGMVRAVAVEPVPTTYFLLRWNLHLNGIPVIDQEAFEKQPQQPGAVVMHKAISDAPDSLLRICSPPWSTMNSYLSIDPSVCKCAEETTPCQEVNSVAAGDVLNLFGAGEISLLKLDCEGCEQSMLPALAQRADKTHVKRLVGELHLPDPSLVQLACGYDNAKFLTAVCRGDVGRVDGSDMCTRCNV